MSDSFETLQGGADAVPVKAWVRGVELEQEARTQLLNVARLPFVFRHVAAMPDVHWGIGATVGSVIPTRGAIVPAAVGVDIGCGMVAQRLNLTSRDLPDSLKRVRDAIEARVPVGKYSHPDPQEFPLPRGPGLEVIKAAGLWKAKASPARQLGTLGGGNHFIELCLDECDQVWVMLHSGSRGVGNRVGMHFIKRARQEAEREGIELPDPNLAWLSEHSGLFDAYVDAVGWCQQYAMRNRAAMLRLVLGALRSTLGEFELRKRAINCHHNYVEQERHFGEQVWVTRKGAVRAGAGDLGIIPGSMGARSYIVRGKGNVESFHSCAHGAGRRMSRREAKRRFSLADHARATEGVECRKDKAVIDETPAAYKDIDAVMAAQADLVEVVHTLRQVVCVKG